ncbi:methyltransferase domain-containing protein [Kitasatospora sp. McL0602]|uniref:methyltransferase domain-containing protein n=1 Tax=Kitasatospora sp. McL0602 TaxID=3439530 RepID=UPI003F8A4D8F
MSETLSEGAGRLGSELGRVLLSNGSMAPEWAETFEAVPRAAFTPDVAWAFDMATGRNAAVDRSEAPDAWSTAVGADVPLVTQWDDGDHTGTDPGSVATSSLSMPSVVMSMLGDLDVRPGMKVLDLGTGPGWNAALLAQRIGSRNVVSVEVDESVSQRARHRLTRHGLWPELVTGDGQLGWPKGGPYDRIIATYGVRDIPRAWVRQTGPGGVIVAPWGTDFSALDAVVRLTVGDGNAASGHFTRMVEFMKARSQRLAFPEHAAYVPEFPGGADAKHRTTLAADDLGDRWSVQRFVIGLAVPHLTHVAQQQGDDTTTAWFYGLTDRSWAAVRWERASTTVYQAGPRRLWQAVERALAWWERQGRPELTRFGLTVEYTRCTPWLDSPDNPVPQQL